VVYAQLWGTSYVQIQRTCSLQPKHDVYKTPVLMGSETCPKVGNFPFETFSYTLLWGAKTFLHGTGGR